MTTQPPSDEERAKEWFAKNRERLIKYAEETRNPTGLEWDAAKIALEAYEAAIQSERERQYAACRVAFEAGRETVSGRKLSRQELEGFNWDDYDDYAKEKK